MNISSRHKRDPREVIVKFQHQNKLSEIKDFTRVQGAKLIKTFDFGDRLEARLGGELAHIQLPPDMTPEQAQKRWAKNPDVEYVATNDLIELNQEPTDRDGSEKLNPDQWGLHNTGQTGGKPDADIDALEAWLQQSGRGGANGGPLIAVVDTGLDIYHESLEENLWTNAGETPGDGIDNDGNGVIDDIHGYNSRDENGYPIDENGHGTHCAAIIGAVDGNSANISGVMKRAQIAGVRFLSRLGMGKMSDALEGLAYADRIGARIISNSWGGGPYNRAMKDVLEASPALHVFAAGNESNNNDESPTYPASYDLPNVLAVAATDHHDELAGFSNFGADSVDIAAPGDKILSAVQGGEYRQLSGTSMAAPHVTGAAGLILSEYPNLSNKEVKTRLLNSVDQLESLDGKVRSGGRLNAARALERDEVPPSAAESVQVHNSGPGRISVSFDPGGDDGKAGQASQFLVRVSENPIVPGETDLENLQIVAQGRPPEVGPVKLDLSSRRWSEDKTLHYAVEMEDNVGNVSAPALAQLKVAASKVAFNPGERSDKDVWNSTWEWTQVEAAGRGLVWTDSADSDYGAASTWIRSADIPLQDFKNPKLVFEAKTDLEANSDFLTIKVGRKTHPVVYKWRDVGELTGTQDWNLREIDLSRYAGETVRLAFWMEPDGRRSQDGVYLDNIMIVDEA